MNNILNALSRIGGFSVFAGCGLTVGTGLWTNIAFLQRVDFGLFLTIFIVAWSCLIIFDVVQILPHPKKLTLDERLKQAGLMTIEEAIKNNPMNNFMTHVGVHDLKSFEEWLIMRRVETLKMYEQMKLDKKEDHDLFEWVEAHSHVFWEVMENFRAATKDDSPCLSHEVN